MNETASQLPIDYQRRNRHLHILGFDSYSHYLNSEMWKIIRSQVLERDKFCCIVCARRASDVHHNSYELPVLIGKDLSQLVSLCRFHHEQIEFNDWSKRDLVGAREALKAKGVVVPELKHFSIPVFSGSARNKIRSTNPNLVSGIVRRNKEDKKKYLAKKKANKKNKNKLTQYLKRIKDKRASM